MKCNIGRKEQMARAVAGSVVAAFGIVLPSLVVLAVGIVLLATAAYRFCPLYLPLGIDNCKDELTED